MARGSKAPGPPTTICIMSTAQFEKAVSTVQNLPKDGPLKPTTSQQLQFYSLYKQATVGDVNTSRPGMFDLTGKAKWCVHCLPAALRACN